MPQAHQRMVQQPMPVQPNMMQNQVNPAQMTMAQKYQLDTAKYIPAISP